MTRAKQTRDAAAAAASSPSSPSHSSSSSATTTRGMRHLKAYLGDGAEAAAVHARHAAALARAAPLLAAQARQRARTAMAAAAAATAATTTGDSDTHAMATATHTNDKEQQQQQQQQAKTMTTAATAPLPACVVQHLRIHRRDGATHALRTCQLHAVHALAATTSAAVATMTTSEQQQKQQSTTATTSHERADGCDATATFAVKRVLLRSADEVVDTIAIAALTRHCNSSNSNSSSTAAAAAAAAGDAGSVLCVLVEDDVAAATLQTQLRTRYGLHVLVYTADAPRYPTLPDMRGGRTLSSALHEQQQQQQQQQQHGGSGSSSSSDSAKSRKRARRGGGAADVVDGTSANNTTATAEAVSAAEAAAGVAGDAAATTTTTAAATAVVVVMTAAGLLAVDRRSALWKFVGAYVIALLQPHATSPLLQLLHARTSALPSSHASAHGSNNNNNNNNNNGSSQTAHVTPTRLSQQRWSCLGHCRVACVLATHPDSLVDAALDWLLTLHAQPALAASSSSCARNAHADDNNTATTTTTAAVAVRDVVRVHYLVASGESRVRVLCALIASLRAGSGLLVHCATRQCCAFVYTLLYALGADVVPSHVRLLTDCENADDNNNSNNMTTAAAAAALCAAFDEAVAAGATATQTTATTAATTTTGAHDSSTSSRHTAAVLLSCSGLVPSRGSVYVAYDMLLDVCNFAQFVCDMLTPAAYRSAVTTRAAATTAAASSPDTQQCTSNSNNSNIAADAAGGAAVIVRRVTDVQPRKRATSPPPPSSSSAVAQQQRRRRHNKHSNDDDEEGSDGANATTVTPARVLYKHILLLLRPNEVRGMCSLFALHAPRHRLVLSALPSRLLPATRCADVATRLRGLHRRLFALQNAAYAAYKATMLLYSSMSNSNSSNNNGNVTAERAPCVYAVADVDVAAVAAEYGYADAPPLLDLRTRDTAYRPRADYYAAARQRQAHAQRAYRLFAQQHIPCEPAVPHVVDDADVDCRPARRMRKRW